MCLELFMTSETRSSEASCIPMIVDGMKMRKAQANSIESKHTENVFIYNVSGLFLHPKVMKPFAKQFHFKLCHIPGKGL